MIFVFIHLTQQIVNTAQVNAGRVLGLWEEGKQYQIFRKTMDTCFLIYHCSHFYASHSTTVLSSSVEMFCKVNRCMVKMSAIPVRAQDRDVKNK